MARQAGALRLAESRRMKLPGRAGCPPDNLGQDINGAAAEIAFARAIGEAPSLSVNSFGAPDVAGYHVRSTDRPRGRLIVRPGDPASNLYVLVIGQSQRWRVIGTITGAEAMRPEFWYDRNGRPGCYMVPQESLRRLDPRPAPTAQPRGALDRPLPNASGHWPRTTIGRRIERFLEQVWAEEDRCKTGRDEPPALLPSVSATVIAVAFLALILILAVAIPGARPSRVLAFGAMAFVVSTAIFLAVYQWVRYFRRYVSYHIDRRLPGPPKGD
ncbi:MAG TPA: hypothetical protein VF590_12495 [Isosphaeraceae bacterium]